MYNLGEQFNVDYSSALANPENVFQGNKYRFTLLTERLIRLEYNEFGNFSDEPTLLVLNRNFPKVECKVKQDKNYLEITTSYFKLFYSKDKKFTNKNLKVQILNTDKVWVYKHVEAKNYPASQVLENDKVKNIKSLYSLDGFVSIDDSKTKIFTQTGTTLDSNKMIDTYLFVYLNSFELCLKDYFALTGSPALIPRYALGNWWSRNNNYNDEQLKDLVDNFDKHNIPLSIILLDKDWHLKVSNTTLKTGFTFNKDNFKAPYEMISYLHNKGIRLGLSINPVEGIYSIDDYYEKATMYLKSDENGVIPYNVLDPKWVDVYLKLFIHPLDALGVDFYFLDCQNEFLLNHYQFNDMARNYKRRSMLLGYNNEIAAHRYSILYAGKSKVSWESLKMIPLYNANATNIGVTWYSHDVGGYFKGIEDSELYIRYVQLATFSPILKFGADSGKYYKREPWRWNIKTLGIVRDYLQLRHKLIPYLYCKKQLN